MKQQERITVPDMTVEQRMANYYDCVTEYLRGQIEELLVEIQFLEPQKYGLDKLDPDVLKRELDALLTGDNLDFDHVENVRHMLTVIRDRIRDWAAYADSIAHDATRVLLAVTTEDAAKAELLTNSAEGAMGGPLQ